MHRRPSPAIFALAAVLLAPAVAQDASIFLRNGRVHVRPGAVLESASVLIEGGKIKAVGRELAPPEGAVIVEAEGLDVYPSFIDPLNDALLEIYPAARGALGGGDRALDLFDTFAADRRSELRRAGVGVVGLGVAANGGRSGVAAVIGVEPAADGGPVVIASDRFVQVDIAQRQRGGGGFGGGFGGGGGNTIVGLASRDAAVRGLEEALDGAKKYRETWEKYEKDFEEYKKKLGEGVKTESRPAEKKDEPAAEESSERPKLPDDFRNWPREKQREWTRENMRRRPRGESGGPASGPTPSASDKLKPPEKPKTEPEKEALVKVLKRETPMWIGAEWRQDLGWVLDFAEKRDIKVAVMGAAEAGSVLDRLKALRAVVVLPPPVSFEEDPLGGASEDLCRTLAKAGVPFTFATAGHAGYGPAGLRFAVALAVGRGLSEDDALAAVTVNAARALGLEKTLGTIEPGREACLMMLKGSPFDVRNKILKSVQRGQVKAEDN